MKGSENFALAELHREIVCAAVEVLFPFDLAGQAVEKRGSGRYFRLVWFGFFHENLRQTSLILP